MSQWSKPILLSLLLLLTLLIPGIRRGIFVRLLKNRYIRNFGLKVVMGTPFLREQLLSKIFPGKSSVPDLASAPSPNEGHM